LIVATADHPGAFASVTVRVRVFGYGLVGLITTMLRQKEIAASGTMR
jgi:hypothetical protein